MPVPEYTGEYTLKSGEGFDVSTINGKSVIITGGASGIGKEIVKTFISAGASFVTIGDLQESGQQLADELGDRVAFVKTDVTKWADHVNLFQTALIRSPSHLIDTVISNAGISGRDSLYWDDSEQDGEPIEPTLKILNTNLVGCIYTCKLALHYLTRQPNPEKHDRCLILMSSIAGYCDQPGTPIYCASKYGIRGIMSSLRRTAHKQDVRVGADARNPCREPRSAVKSRSGLGRADAAAASMHLASDPLLNGRCVAIVPRHEDPRGYMDMKKDDFSDDLAGTWQRIMVAASHRA
ncbi:hypothetical protein N7507_009828 [Penicillium longicatenatum]|nr:hypothetical protein N7507_009828 [Penicillium longicatenatum]